MNTCQCGCDQVIPAISQSGRPQRFVHGHNSRLQGKGRCKIATCRRPYHSNGYCGAHGMRVAKYGTVHPITASIDPVRYFWSKVRRPHSPRGCWEWMGDTNVGYGRIAARSGFTVSRTKLAHRIAFELLVGPIQPGLHLDHLCRNTVCVNPEHLEPVTPDENTKRGLHGVLRTHCRFGHELTVANTYVRPSDGSRKCRECSRIDARRRRAGAGS